MPLNPALLELSDADARRLIDGLGSADGPRLSTADQLAFVESIRGRSPEVSKALDKSLLSQIGGLRQGLLQAREHLGELREVLDKLSATPWHPGVYLGSMTLGASPSAVVACSGSVRVVGLASTLRIEDLAVGDEVLLGQEMNVIMHKAAAPVPRTGETAEFHHCLPDGRLVLRHRDEQVVVRPAAGFDARALSAGDCVRWDRAVGLVFERIERARDSHLFLEDTPQQAFDDIGGLDAQIAQVTRAIELHMLHPEAAARYRVRRAAAVLLAGPPGTGKTMIARALANWLARRSPSGRSRFMSIKPGELLSMWYGQSESNYRDVFRIARQAGDADPSTPVVMFFDEVDAIGAVRGQSLFRVDDRVLTSFMAELDGLQARGNILVVAATNRRDTLDPGLARPGRLGDVIIEVPRPGMAAAAAVFDRHLPPSIPYATSEGEDERASRRRLIDAAVSRLYAPNGEGDVASVMFRDGTRRAVAARDLMSGAHIANIARAAIERACYRHIEAARAVAEHPAIACDDRDGLRDSDVLEAIADELAAAAAALTPANCHAFVSNLPQDLAVVRVEPIVRQVRRPHRYLRVA
jgi:proteasome-associated ATPase